MIYLEPLTTDSEQRKAQGWVLSVDPASNNAGVSLWNSGKLIAYDSLNAISPKDSFSSRLKQQVYQLNHFLQSNGFTSKNPLTNIIFEGTRSRLVTIATGAYMTCSLVNAKLHGDSFVESTSWKYYARGKGAQGNFKEIKGIKALKEIAFPADELGINSDDVADSILMYMTWVHRK